MYAATFCSTPVFTHVDYVSWSLKILAANIIMATK